MNLNILGNLFGGIIDIIKEVVPDKDKQLELITQVQTQQLEMTKVLVSQATVPWVDALVKLMYALSHLIKEHWRPLVSSYLMLKGVTDVDLLQQLHNLGAVGDAAITGMVGSFPAWMYSRHKGKSRSQ